MTRCLCRRARSRNRFDLKFIMFHLFMRDTRVHGRNMRRCWLHPTVYRGQMAVGLRGVSPWDFFSLSPLDKIGNGAVIEVWKATRCGYVTCVIVIERRARSKARNVRAAVKFLFIPLTRQLRSLDVRTRMRPSTRAFFFPSFYIHARTRTRRMCD